MTDSRPRWIISSSEETFVGDHVALARHPDSVGRIIGVADHHGIPSVELIEGPGTGRVVSAWPADILLRVQR